jgi:hypothetical protein
VQGVGVMGGGVEDEITHTHRSDSSLSVCY